MEKSKALCRGCVDDYYNGNNNDGIAECWSFKSAEVVEKKFVHVSMKPPWNVTPETTLNCNRRSGYVKVNPDVTQ